MYTYQCEGCQMGQSGGGGGCIGEVSFNRGLAAIGLLGNS